MLVFSCMGTARQNGRRDARPQGASRLAEGSGGRPVAVATSSYVNIIEALLENGSMSRSELATSTGLSRSALTEMSRVLIQHQFVEESPSVIDKQRKGRPSIMLSLNARYGYFVGVGLTEDPPLMALTDCHGNVLAEHEIGMVMDPEEVAKAIAQGIPDLTRASNISREKVVGIGVALSGHVDHAQGICLHSNLLGWHNVPIARIVERVTEIPTYIDNDAHAVSPGGETLWHGPGTQELHGHHAGQEDRRRQLYARPPVSRAHRSRGRDRPLCRGARGAALRMRKRRLRGCLCFEFRPATKGRGTGSPACNT